MVKYDTSSIFKMEEVDHVRNHSAMFIGDTETPIKLVDEVLDNAIDECLHSKKANKLAVVIDNKEHSISVIDTGRGFPFDQNLPLEDDPPVMTSVKLMTSGKFNKSKGGAYDISVGLHGIGNSVVQMLSKKFIIETYRDGLHGTYTFTYDGKIDRTQKKYTKAPFSTKVTFYPHKKHFKSLDINASHIEERLRIVCADNLHLSTALVVDGAKKVIKGNLDDLILGYLGSSVDRWITLENRNKPESCIIKMGWDNKPPQATKVLGVVNLKKVLEGSHVLKISRVLKSVFSEFGKKRKYQFQPEDVLNSFRLYIDLKLIKPAYKEQIKMNLSPDSDLSIMEFLEKGLKDYFKENEDHLIQLLDRFQTYRNSLTGKKVLRKGNSKRVSSEFTKLRDCSSNNGELLIGEGDSAVGGIITVRDPKKHAILPLKGVVSNAVTKKDLLENTEVKEILQCLGCGIDNDFNINKLRYDKIIIAADADPAGNFITALLIGLFITKTPELIKQGKIYVCVTPLYGYGRLDKFMPLWSKSEVDKARKKGKSIRRFKGLGEFSPKELKKFTLDPKYRKLVQLSWTDSIEDLMDLYSRSTEKRDLVMRQGKWSNVSMS